MVFYMGRTVMEIKQFCTIKVHVDRINKDKLKIVDLKNAKKEEIDQFLTELDELHHQSDKQGVNHVEIKSVKKSTSCKNAALTVLRKLKKFTR